MRSNGLSFYDGEHNVVLANEGCTARYMVQAAFSLYLQEYASRQEVVMAKW